MLLPALLPLSARAGYAVAASCTFPLAKLNSHKECGVAGYDLQLGNVARAINGVASVCLSSTGSRSHCGNFRVRSSGGSDSGWSILKCALQGKCYSGGFDAGARDGVDTLTPDWDSGCRTVSGVPLLYNARSSVSVSFKVNGSTSCTVSLDGPTEASTKPSAGCYWDKRTLWWTDGSVLTYMDTAQWESVCDAPPPTAAPSFSPPSFSPSAPSVPPSASPSVPPSPQPTDAPVTAPPTSAPVPPGDPTRPPVPPPTAVPTQAPSTVPPTSAPTTAPSVAPSRRPSTAPTKGPTARTEFPTWSPLTAHPSQAPAPPTAAPSVRPTRAPSAVPSRNPSAAPTAAPVSPTTSPRVHPTGPSVHPTVQPTESPTTAIHGARMCNGNVWLVLSPSECKAICDLGGMSGYGWVNCGQLPSCNEPVHLIPLQNDTHRYCELEITDGCGPDVDNCPGQYDILRLVPPPPTGSPEPPTTPPSTGHPSSAPTWHPTAPSVHPTGIPSVHPTGIPSVHPTGLPTESPWTPLTFAPVAVPGPTPAPGLPPQTAPTVQPTLSPSSAPSGAPTDGPTVSPSSRPTVEPSALPRAPPTASPSSIPSTTPSEGPTGAPTLPPSGPSAQPTGSPRILLTLPPLAAPTARPGLSRPVGPPSRPPTLAPHPAPAVPTIRPAVLPATLPTLAPLSFPEPSAAPTTAPTAQPALAPLDTSLPGSPPPTVEPRSLTSRATASPSGVLRPPTAAPVTTAQSAAVPTESPTWGPTDRRETLADSLKQRLREVKQLISEARDNITHMVAKYENQLGALQLELAAAQARAAAREGPVDTTIAQPATMAGAVSGVMVHVGTAASSAATSSGSSVGAASARTAGRVSAVLSLAKCPSKNPKRVHLLLSPLQIPVGAGNDSMRLGCVAGNWGLVAVPTAASAIMWRLGWHHGARSTAAVGAMLLAMVTAGIAECSTTLIVKTDDGQLIGAISLALLCIVALGVLAVGWRAPRWAEAQRTYEGGYPRSWLSRLITPRYEWRPKAEHEQYAASLAFCFEGYRPQTACEHGVAMILTILAGMSVGWADDELDCAVSLGLTTAATFVQLVYTLVRDPYLRPVDTHSQGLSLSLELGALVSLVVAMATGSPDPLQLAEGLAKASLYLGMVKMVIDLLLLLYFICMPIFAGSVRKADEQPDGCTGLDGPVRGRTEMALFDVPGHTAVTPLLAASDESTNNQFVATAQDPLERARQEIRKQRILVEAEQEEHRRATERIESLEKKLRLAEECGSRNSQEVLLLRRELQRENQRRHWSDARIRELESEVKRLEALLKKRLGLRIKYLQEQVERAQLAERQRAQLAERQRAQRSRKAGVQPRLQHSLPMALRPAASQGTVPPGALLSSRARRIRGAAPLTGSAPRARTATRSAAPGASPVGVGRPGGRGQLIVYCQQRTAQQAHADHHPSLDATDAARHPLKSHEFSL
eukprot:TRINITY_DN8186_c0_g1_i3.p1 TRINITY_DN8186_c0_g1~~TRINITY_DN8186_c0_g1_i3.p1  ORF type:complete len:1450 (+),score=64.86 TRINITY_DN8186_c0_g1_i3:85-4434(+)